MLRWITLACGLIVLFAAATFIYQTPFEPIPEPAAEPHERPSDGPPPKLEIVGGKSHQFDVMVVGAKGGHSWEFKNVGRGPLEVWLEETTCSCTVATLKSAEGEKARKITIAPGKSAPIEVDWEGRKAGRFGQAATIGTTDPDNRSITLTILGTVVAPVEVRPSETIVLPDALPEEARSTNLAIVSVDRPDLKLVKVASTKPEAIITEVKPMAAGDLERLKVKSGYDVAVKVKPGLPTGRFTEEILVETDHPSRPSLKVTVAGNTVGPISVLPARIRMPSVANLVGGSQDLSLIVRGDRETHFEVASKPEQLKVSISKDDRPETHGRYRLTVTVPPRTAPGLVDDPIVLKTDHPKVKELRIPVSIYVSTRQGAG